MKDVSYNEQECGYVLDIMRMFCISYPADAHTEFIPTLCKSDSKFDPKPKSWKQHAAYQFRYTFLPETVLHRLMIFCFANLRPGRRWRRGFWLECEPLGLSTVIRTEGPGNEENELQIDVYTQKEEVEAWMWLQPLCQQIETINNDLSLKAEAFVFAEKDNEEKWFPLKTIWNWKRKGDKYLQGDEVRFPIQPIMDLIYGKYLPNVEKKLMEEWEDESQRISSAALSQRITAEVADLTGVDLSRPLEEQCEMCHSFIAELNRSNDLREQEKVILQKQIDAIEENTKAVQENTWTLQQSEILLHAIRDGEVELPTEVMKALINAFQQSNEPVLRVAGQKMKWHFWKEKGQLLRELLGDAANFATVAPVLVTLGKDYGPALLNLIMSLVTA